MMPLRSKLARFLMVGVACAILFFALNYFFLNTMHMGTFIALVCTYSITFGGGYILQKRFTFRSASSHKVSLPRYFTLHVGSFFLVYLVTETLQPHMSNSAVSSSLIATALCGVFSFLISLTWVFPTESMPQRNAQYNFGKPDSFAIRIADRMRFGMYERFADVCRPVEADTVLDVGTTSDQTYVSSNYFEMRYPFKHRITALGVDDASFLEDDFPGLKFVEGTALALPFPDVSFDYVHSSAVLEHVGSFRNQQLMISECLRVARKGVFLTTPNRWFPVEFHTQLPLVHWLPKPTFRRILIRLGFGSLATEEALNLMTASELRSTFSMHTDWNLTVDAATLFGLPSNLLLFGTRGVQLPNSVAPR